MLFDKEGSCNLSDFCNYVTPLVTYVSKNEFRRRVPAGYIGCGEWRLESIDKGRPVVEEVNIVINRDAFVIDGIDYRKVIPLVIWHEAVEIFALANQCVEVILHNIPEPESRIMARKANLFALQEECIYANSLGLCDISSRFVADYVQTHKSENNLVRFVSERSEIASNMRLGLKSNLRLGNVIMKNLL